MCIYMHVCTYSVHVHLHVNNTHACTMYMYQLHEQSCMYIVRTVEDKKTFPFSSVERLKYAPYRFRTTVKRRGKNG